MTRPTTTAIPSRGDLDVVPVILSGYAAASITELLEHCDGFFRTATPTVHAELLAYLDRQPTGPDRGWLLDMLGFNAIYLQAKIALAAALADQPSADQRGGHR